MQKAKYILWSILKLFFFWILIFDFQRVLFSIHHWDRLSELSTVDWLLTFVYSFRLDLSSAAYLSALPLIFLLLSAFWPTKWFRGIFIGILFFEVGVLALIHAGEINAYTEWGHKLTSRVFMHLSNPDEVFRTADYSMTVWFVIYSVLEFVFGWRMIRWLFKKSHLEGSKNIWLTLGACVVTIPLVLGLTFILARGGLQQIPLNIDSAYFSNNHTANDLSVNSAYFFASSFIAYNKSDIDDLLPPMELTKAQAMVEEMYDFPKEHANYFLENKRPNIVMVVMESWAAEGVGCLNGGQGATPEFDKLAQEGLLFTNLYATAGTSEIGNSSIFSGNPAIPEISISVQPEKHRKMPSLNQDLKQWGYHSGYIFSGDLKYGNIGGYFMDHGFDDVKDENDFPSGLDRGKLNYYDEDLYTIFLKRINESKEPFLQCAFTGSTHSPFDHPKRPNQTWTGEESAFMNSLVYADESLGEFIEKCKKEPWYDNTLFIFVSDHSHHTPRANDVHTNKYYRIPLLFFGEPLKDAYKGKRIDKLGSQSDIIATLLYQMNGEIDKYLWSKDLMNPASPEFALHTTIRGFGWVTPQGGLVYHLDYKKQVENTLPDSLQEVEWMRSKAFLHSIYKAYKDL